MGVFAFFVFIFINSHTSFPFPRKVTFIAITDKVHNFLFPEIEKILRKMIMVFGEIDPYHHRV